MFKLLAVEISNHFSVFRHLYFEDDSLHGSGSRIRILAAVHIQFGFFFVCGYNAVYVSMEFCFPFLRRSEGCTAETWSDAQNASFVYRQSTLPVYILLFTVPSEIYFHFAADSITFGGNRSQRTIHAGQNLTVLDDIHIVDATFSGNIQINAAAVATHYVTHESIVEAEVNQNLIAGCGAYVAGPKCFPYSVAG